MAADDETLRLLTKAVFADPADPDRRLVLADRLEELEPTSVQPRLTRACCAFEAGSGSAAALEEALADWWADLNGRGLLASGQIDWAGCLPPLWTYRSEDHCWRAGYLEFLRLSVLPGRPRRPGVPLHLAGRLPLFAPFLTHLAVHGYWASTLPREAPALRLPCLRRLSVLGEGVPVPGDHGSFYGPAPRPGRYDAHCQELGVITAELPRLERLDVPLGLEGRVWRWVAVARPTVEVRPIRQT